MGSTSQLSVLQLIAGLDPAHGGPSYSVPRLCRALFDAGVDVELHSVLINGVDSFPDVPFRRELFDHFGADLPIVGALRLSPALDKALKTRAQTVDVVHNNGLWLVPNMQAEAAATRAGKPFVCSPRGMLSPEALAISRFKKRLMGLAGQNASLRAVTCFHATGEAEWGEIRALGLTAPVAVIPNGIDVGPEESPRLADAGDARTALSLGRIHPKKGLVNLLQAWSRVETLHPGWRLRIVGPAEVDHDKELLALATELGLERVSIEPPVYGAGKDALYRDADLFVLPTKNENFGLTVAESLAAGRPAICTKGAPWGGLERERCGWWIDQGVEALAAALGQAMALPPDELAVMGRRGRAWVARDYSWDRVAADMLNLYTWLKTGGARPEFVRLD